MKHFQIYANRHLSRETKAFYHVRYTGWKNQGNPDFLNVLKNTFNDLSEAKLRSAVKELHDTLREDLPQILEVLGFNSLVVCVVPRAKAENAYYQNQLLFRATVQMVIRQMPGFVDGTGYIRRHTSTRTTHFRKPIPNYVNDGPQPYPGITKDTCEISPHVKGNDVLLIDDIYTPGVNIDEDAINTLLNAGAGTVTFYAVGRVIPDYLTQVATLIEKRSP